MTVEPGNGDKSNPSNSDPSSGRPDEVGPLPEEIAAYRRIAGLTKSPGSGATQSQAADQGNGEMPLPPERPEDFASLPDEVVAYRRIAGLTNTSGVEVSGSAAGIYEIWTYPTGDEAPLSDEATGGLHAAAGDPAARRQKKKRKKKSKVRLEVAHQTTGRVRLRVAAGKNDPDLLKQIADSFSAIPGMERITISPVTGSIVLNYDEGSQKSFNDRLMRNLIAQGSAPMIGSEFEELAKKIENQAEFLAKRSQAARAVVDFVKRLDREIKLATHNVVDLKIVLAVGIIFLTIFEVGANTATPIWLTLSIFTFNHFLELHNPIGMEAETVRAPVVFR